MGRAGSGEGKESTRVSDRATTRRSKPRGGQPDGDRCPGREAGRKERLAVRGEVRARPVASSVLVCSPGGPGHRPLFEDRRTASKGSASLLPQVINLQGQTLTHTHTCRRPGLGSWAARVVASASQRREDFQALFPKEFPACETPEKRGRRSPCIPGRAQHFRRAC